MTQKKENVILLLSLLITTGVIAGGLWWLFGNQKSLNVSDNAPKGDRPAMVETDAVTSKPSAGDEILFQRDLNPEKQAAAKAIAAQNYTEGSSLSLIHI
jgi:branched-chain amino acid transport system substrate-binding protein